MGVDAAAADRLPWLADEPSPRAQKNPRRASLWPLAAAAFAIVGTSGFWLGMRSVDQQKLPASPPAPATLTVQLPPQALASSPEVQLPAQKEVSPSPQVEVQPVASREVRIATPQQRFKPAREAAANRSGKPEQPESGSSQSREGPTAGPVAAAPQPVAQPFVLPSPWNPRVFQGASGRLVQVGAFGSVLQAKRGWWFMVREYPAMAHLPAVVRPTRNSRGRVFYRFQVGTTSQAHSEVLCQRMEKIRFSCAVVGLPWKAKVER